MAKRPSPPLRQTHLGRYLAEMVRAFAVIALVFFNFAHTATVSAAPVDYAIASQCGDGHLSGTADHDRHDSAPCHACRTGAAAALPPLPTGILAVFLPADQVGYAPFDAPHPASAPQRVGNSRDPPAAA